MHACTCVHTYSSLWTVCLSVSGLQNMTAMRTYICLHVHTCVRTCVHTLVLIMSATHAIRTYMCIYIHTSTYIHATSPCHTCYTYVYIHVNTPKKKHKRQQKVPENPHLAPSRNMERWVWVNTSQNILYQNLSLQRQRLSCLGSNKPIPEAWSLKPGHVPGKEYPLPASESVTWRSLMTTLVLPVTRAFTFTRM